MKDNKAMTKPDSLPDLYDLMRKPVKLAEFLTGMLISEARDWKLSAGRLIQATIKWDFLTQLGYEINRYIEKGKIDEDFLKNPRNKHSLRDLLEFIDSENPDEERFEAMKSLFFRAVSEDFSEKDQILSYQFMQLIKKLESADLLVLKASYNLVNGNLHPNFANSKAGINMRPSEADEWLQTIATQIGHSIKSLVEVNEGHLIAMKLILPRIGYGDKQIDAGQWYRLTGLGHRLCQFIYDEKLKED